MPQTSTSTAEPSGLTKACAVLAIIVAIVGFFIPVVGVMFATPIALILACVALWGSDFNSLGLVTTIISAVNYMISPTFWAVIGMASDKSVKDPTFTFMAWFGLLIVVLAIGLIVRKYTKT